MNRLATPAENGILTQGLVPSGMRVWVTSSDKPLGPAELVAESQRHQAGEWRTVKIGILWMGQQFLSTFSFLWRSVAHWALRMLLPDMYAEVDVSGAQGGVCVDRSTCHPAPLLRKDLLPQELQQIVFAFRGICVTCRAVSSTGMSSQGRFTSND